MDSAGLVERLAVLSFIATYRCSIFVDYLFARRKRHGRDLSDTPERKCNGDDREPRTARPPKPRFICTCFFLRANNRMASRLSTARNVVLRFRIESGNRFEKSSRNLTASEYRYRLFKSSYESWQIHTHWRQPYPDGI